MASNVLNETFADATKFSSSEALFSDGSSDYLGLSDGETSGDFGGESLPNVKAYAGFDGFFLTGQDLDGEGASLPITINWTGLNIAGLTNLQFSGDFAEFFDSPGDIDAANDSLLIEYQIDGSGFQQLLAFEGADFSSTTFNGIFREDTDFDGTGDGAALGNAAQTFTKPIVGTGSSLDLRFSAYVDSGDEDFAADNFLLTGDDGTPDTTTPAIIALSPADDTNDVAVDSDLIVTFDEVVQAGTGSVIIRSLADDSVVESLDVTSAPVTFSGTDVTIDPASDLAASSGFYVEIDDGAVQDLAGNSFAGLAGNSAWNFMTAAAAAPAEIVITEIMQNPDAVPDSAGEWFEIVNIGSTTIDLDGWTIRDDDSDSFGVSGPLTVGPGEYLVFGNNADTATNGGITVDFEYSGFTLANGADEVVLIDGSNAEIDRVAYDGGPDFPDPTGASMALADPSLDNTVGSNWAESTVPFGDGDLGTPGAANDSLLPPDLAINELRISTESFDDISNYVEVFGAEATSLDGVSLVVLSGEFEPGQVDFAFDLSGRTIDEDNLLLVANSDIADAIPQAVTEANDLQTSFNFFGSPSTVLLVDGFTGAQGQDLDADDDGVLDSPIGTIIDSVSLVDGDGTSDRNYSTTIVGPDGSFAPAGIARQPDETGDFVQLAFGDVGLDTPGTLNMSIDPPETVFIHEIQGPGDASPIEGQTVTIDAIVVGDFQGGDGLSGFYVQEEDGDADTDPMTSEGIFVFEGSSPAVDVAVGDRVQVTGTVDEFFGLTELTNVTDVTLVSSSNPLPTAATVSFPVASLAELEAVEGMRATIPDTLFVTEYFNLDRFGEVRLSSDGPGNQPGTDGRLEQYTQFNTPDVDGFAAYQDAIANRQIVLDDASSVQNPDTLIFGRGGDPLSNTTTLRGGDTVNNLSGILDFRFGDYRIQTGEGVDFQPTNPRPPLPNDVGGDLTVASFNVLNFFTTLDVSGNPGSGPNNLEPRGADSQQEFDRQIEKLVTTLSTLDADILGLVELENEFGGDQNGDGLFAIETLVDALNDVVGAGTYAFVDPGRAFVDTGDAISVGAIYKTATVKIADNTSVEILDDSDLPGLGLDFGNPVFDGVSTNRASLAATFEEIATGEKLTVAVNHFKSKGSVNPAPGNEDIGDGQGNNNAIRTQASIALDAWLDSDPTGSNDDDVLIVGDLNAYALEDPITLLESEGYSDLAEVFVGAQSYSFVFDGQFGTLDYALANDSLLTQVTGATEWHINADEPDALDYNLDFGRDPTLFDGTVPYRTSDHDPLIVGLDLQSESVEPLVAKAVLDFDPSGFFPQLDYSEDDVLLAEVTQFSKVRDPDDEIPIEISAVDSDDSFTVFGREFQIDIPDRAIATLNDGIAIKDGDDGFFGTDTRRIDGDETLVIAIKDDAAFDFATSAEVRLGKFSGTGVTVEAIRDGASVGSVTAATEMVSIEPSEGFDRLEIRAEGDTQFTFLGVTVFDLFADGALVG
ncbi:MAG: ExeM/NucH family extracellular endonuclease [Alphaproteobacteria bacterium]|jgi:predicted extracellular nuclease|nr:ExeM/NucH family extracellular endonuclease [Alphaproteobacteria bacterium]